MKRILPLALVFALICSLAAFPALAATKDENNPWINEKSNLMVFEDFSDTAYYKNNTQFRTYMSGYDSLVERVYPDFKKTDIQVKNKQLTVVPYSSDGIFWNLKNPVSRDVLKNAVGMGFYVKNNTGQDIDIAFYASGQNAKKEGAMWYFYGLKGTIIDKDFNVKTSQNVYDQIPIPKDFEGWMLFDIADFVNNTSSIRPKPMMVPGEYSLDRIGYRNFPGLPETGTASQNLIFDDFFLYGAKLNHAPGNVKLPFLKQTASSSAASSKAAASSKPPSAASVASAASASSAAASSEAEISAEKVSASIEGVTADAVPEGAQISVYRITEGDDYNNAEGVLADAAEKFALYDMKLLKDGAEVALSGTANVSIPGPVGFSRSKLDVMRITDSGKEKADWSLSEDGTQIIIKTDSLGKFAVINAKSQDAGTSSTAAAQNSAPGSENKSGGSLWWILIPIGVIVLAAGVLVLLKVKKLAFFKEKQ